MQFFKKNIGKKVALHPLQSVPPQALVKKLTAIPTEYKLLFILILFMAVRLIMIIATLLQQF